MTRVQDKYQKLKPILKSIDVEKYSLKFEHLKKLKSSCVIMHPLPRRKEIDPKVELIQEPSTGDRKEMVCG